MGTHFFFTYIFRDLDQVIDDIQSPKHLAQFKATKTEEDLPGLGQWYCTECAKWFEGENSLITHRKGSTHKRRLVYHKFNELLLKFLRLKALKEGPYTQKDAEAAVGLGTDNGKRSQSTLEASNDMEVEMETATDLAT